MISLQQSRLAASEFADSLERFASRIVATPSLSGQEGNVAAIISDEMKLLGFDDVWTDQVGNVIGRITGGNGPVILLNGHMDVVDPGPPDGWLYPAYSGHVHQGHLWGRGSVDMKGPVAAMIYGVSLFKKLGVRPAGDVLMTVAVMEEIGGLGSQFLATQVTADAAIIGEPCRNRLRLGHRGRIELQVTFGGRSAHASAPELAINPHFAAAEFLRRLPDLSLHHDPVLGQSTIAPTLYLTDQASANVIPSEVTIYLDWRNVPSESPVHAVEMIKDLVGFADRTASVKVTEQPRQTYTGQTRPFASIFPPFVTSPDCPLATAAKAVIETSTGRAADPDVWKFATDGGHLAQAGIPCIGFGPGDDRLAHTNQERLSIQELGVAAATYAPLACQLAQVLKKAPSGG